MKIIEHEQGSEAWGRWRKSGIGASDIGVLMGDDPYRTPYQLWEDKCGYAKPIDLSGPMKHGIANEPIARAWVNAHESLNLKPICCEDEDTPIFRASLDGWDDFHKVAVEIKCPVSEATIETARVSNSIHKHWYDQMQWQMMICEAERAYFAVYDYRVKGCIVLQQWPDKKLWEDMREKAQSFWKLVVRGTPPTLTHRDYQTIEDAELKRLIDEYTDLDRQEKEIKTKKNLLRDPIYSYGGGDNFRAYGCTVMNTHSRTSYDTAKMKEDGLDMGKYEKRGPGGFRIQLPRRK